MPSPNKSSKLAAVLLLLSALAAVAAEAPSILAREAWQAKPPSAKMATQKPTAIMVHHTGSTQKLKTTLQAKMRGLQRFSQAKEKLADGRTKPAWPDVPYHFYIAADGSIAEGRLITAVGDTNTAYDPSGYIQVVVEGNFETETLSEQQVKSLRALLQWLKTEHQIKSTAINAHNEKAQTACPGKDLGKRLPGIIAELN